MNIQLIYAAAVAWQIALSAALLDWAAFHVQSGTKFILNPVER